MSRHYSSEQVTMYLTFGFHAEESACTVTKNEHNSYYTAEVLVKNDLFDDLADKDTVETGLDAMAEASGNDYDNFAVGYVDEEGWYEPPTICWSDPSCSDPGDGDTTALKVTVDMNADSLAQYIDGLIADMEEWADEEQVNAVKALGEKLKQRLAEEIMKALDSVDGTDLL